MKIDFKNEILFFFKTLMGYSSFFGSFVFLFTAVPILYFSNQRQFAINFFIGAIVMMAIEHAIKLVYKEKRPDYKMDKEKALFEKFQEKTSFPSGHAGIIAVFTTLLFRMNMSVYLNILFLIIAILVGMSRIYLRRHHFTDVIAGYVIGFVVGMII